MADESATSMETEMAFMSVMRAYRLAKESGNADAIAEAERALQEQVRGELRGSEGCV